MPYNLIVVLAPKLAYVDGEGNIKNLNDNFSLRENVIINDIDGIVPEDSNEENEKNSITRVRRDSNVITNLISKVIKPVISNDNLEGINNIEAKDNSKVEVSKSSGDIESLDLISNSLSLEMTNLSDKEKIVSDSINNDTIDKSNSIDNLNNSIEIENNVSPSSILSSMKNKKSLQVSDNNIDINDKNTTKPNTITDKLFFQADVVPYGIPPKVTEISEIIPEIIGLEPIDDTISNSIVDLQKEVDDNISPSALLSSIKKKEKRPSLDSNHLLISSLTTIKKVSNNNVHVKNNNSNSNNSNDLLNENIRSSENINSSATSSNLPILTIPPLSTPIKQISSDNEINNESKKIKVSEGSRLRTVNVRSFIMQTLDSLYNNDYISTRPNIDENDDVNTMKIMFVCESGPSVDMVIGRLGHIGVGTLVGSVNVIALETSKFLKKTDEIDEIDEINENDDNDEIDEQDEEEDKMFLQVASQIRVEQVVEIVTGGATMSFDYLALLTIASTIAGIGLATNNTVAIVASMLISPIMGPVLALTFGSVINNWKLTKLGLKTELLSLLLCILIGFIIGIITILIGTAGTWPTEEMKSRGMLDGLLVGFAIAVPSGMGVALSVLGNNTSSLVGVAISASLLPPAVNCGMALAYAWLGFDFDSSSRDGSRYSSYLTPNSFIEMGGISLALTLVNIAAIYMSALILFRIKEVAPIQNKTVFWQKDIQISREINNANIQSSHKLNMGVLKQELEEFRTNALLRNKFIDQGFGDEINGMTSLDNAFATIGRENNYKTTTPSLLDIFRDDSSIASLTTPTNSRNYKSPNQRPKSTRIKSLSYGEDNSSNGDKSSDNKRSYKSVLTDNRHQKGYPSQKNNEDSSNTRVNSESFSKESLNEIRERFRSSGVYK